MKIVLPLFFMPFMKIPFYITSLSLITLIMILTSSNITSIFNKMFFMDSLSSILILLSLMSVLLIILSMENYMNKNSSLLILMITFMLIMIFLTFNIFNFYILFETVLIPTMILITKMGKQPERLQAGIYLMIYTILASLPLMISILMMKNNLSFLILYTQMYKSKICLFMILAFLVKMPMFFTHLWLPKAHVEAPLEGSMILAAVLLKLGGYGLIRVLPMCMNNLNLISTWLMSISLLGATSTSLNCIRQKDMKALIAYSSVAHMGLTLSSIFSMNMMGLTASVMMMIAHGLSSSALFLLVNDLYTKIHSRNIMLFKGLYTLTPNITFWWFMFSSINISAPPTINTISEIIIIASLLLWSLHLIIPIILVSISSASFSFSLFINISHNKSEMNPFSQTTQKIFLSLFLHLFPLITLIMKTEYMLM